jgi:hypothetical protein
MHGGSIEAVSEIKKFYAYSPAEEIASILAKQCHKTTS